MEISRIEDKEAVKSFLFKDPYLHLYEIGNLQESLYSHINWYAASQHGEILAVALVYTSQKGNEPFLFILENKNIDAAKVLLKSIIDILPDTFNAHLSASLPEVLFEKFDISRHMTYNKMTLKGDILIQKSIKYQEYTYNINRNDFGTVDDFLRKINPNAFFVPAMLNTGRYKMIRKNSDLIAMAGVHFFSRELNIAVIGNVATAPEFRGKGYGGSVTASLCSELYKEVQYIGLNVLTDNTPAIKAYEKIGLMYYNTHEEIHAERKKK
jgi:RimJ/RimL family protein N-acetyltransferase